jgi:hypothetical protein
MVKPIRVALVAPAQLKDWRIAHMARQKEIAVRDAKLQREREDRAWRDQQIAKWRAGVAVVEANNLHGADQTAPCYPGLYWPF